MTMYMYMCMHIAWFCKLTSDDLWGHVSNGAHGIGEGVLQLLGCTKVAELEQQAVLE